MGVALDLADRVVAVTVNHAHQSWVCGIHAEDRFLVRRVTFDVFPIDYGVLEHRVSHAAEIAAVTITTATRKGFVCMQQTLKTVRTNCPTGSSGLRA